MATTLKLPPDLKDRISRVIAGTGQTAHAFMVDAIRTQTECAERHREFVAAAMAAREEFVSSRIGYAMEDIHPYIKMRAEGKKARKPKPRRWRA